MNKKLKNFIFICLTISAVTSPALIYAAEKGIVENGPVKKLNNPVQKHKMSNDNQSTLAATSSHNRKTTLNDDSRGLSGFFIFGIIINIIMAVTFGIWFAKEWRRSKK